MSQFLPFAQDEFGLLADLAEDAFPARFVRWSQAILLGPEATHFVFCEEDTMVVVAGRSHLAGEGMYLSVPGEAELVGGRGIVTSRRNYRGLFTLGGPVEERGRLRYIDGCTDSLLLPPVMRGDPCLNLLHIPSGTKQTRHTHPSFRTGLILSGTGLCVTPEESFALSPGLAFLIPAEVEHSFHTTTEALRVIAFHPDSDVGPTHESHPMVNRTVIAS